MGCLVKLFLTNKSVVEKYDEVVRRVLRAREHAQRGYRLMYVCVKRKSRQGKAEQRVLT